MGVDWTDRIIGKLEAHQKITSDRLAVIEKKIDTLQHFKWGLIGGATVVSILSSIIVQGVKLLAGD